MAVFIELTTDPFGSLLGGLGNEPGRRTRGAGLPHVRRPLRGIEIKDDTYAYITLRGVDNTVIDLLDSSSATGRSTEYSNFILQSVVDRRVDRHQILETFGDSYLFMFGEAPRMLECNAILINSHDFNWKAEFMANYEQYLAGTKSLEKGCRTYLFYDDNIVEGYVLNATTQQNADNPHIIQLSFQLFVANAQTVAQVGDPNFPVRDSVTVPSDVSLVETWDGKTLELVLEETMEGRDYWGPRVKAFEGRDRPVRELIAANVDEWATPMVTKADVEKATLERWERSLKDPPEKTILEKVQEAIEGAGQWVSNKASDLAHGATDWAVDPVKDQLQRLGTAWDSTAVPWLTNELGLKPDSKGNGFGWGNAPTDPNSAGGFVSHDPHAQGGAGAWAGAGAGAGFSFGAGASAGVSSGAGAYASAGAYAGASAGAGAYAGATSGASAGAGSAAGGNWGWGGAVGASAGWSWSPGSGSSSYADSWSQTTSQAGGYLGANSDLSFPTSVDGPGTTNNAGASVPIYGAPAPFASVSVRGRLAFGVGAAGA